jgi:hypothetical protein
MYEKLLLGVAPLNFLSEDLCRLAKEKSLKIFF